MKLQNWSQPITVELELILKDIKRELTKDDYISEEVLKAVLQEVETIYTSARESWNYEYDNNLDYFTGLEEDFINELLRKMESSCDELLQEDISRADKIAVYIAVGIVDEIAAELWKHRVD